MYFVYVLWSNKLNKRYIGSAGNVTIRLDQHNRNMNHFTKGGKPWFLIYTEQFSTKAEALIREKFLKSGIGRKWLDEKFPQYRRLKAL
jgi:putative endonuclease